MIGTVDGIVTGATIGTADVADVRHRGRRAPCPSPKW
jgi:hypothetical protein